ncbi:MAG: glycosyltransferase family 4 protein [Candidatus Moranbacteria bacterium]|nr:glycosyltransferase family 4 protein [Candidatus Moranbacteria bacterium]
MRILFISHSFPPIFGGVERQNYYLSEGLKKHATVKVIANTKGKLWLPVFLPVTFLRSLFLMSSYDVCLVGNGVLAPIGAALKFFHPGKKFFSVVHGLDITFAHKKGLLSRIYKAVNIPSLKKLDKLFMVGNQTIEEAVKIGIAREHCVFIPNGILLDELAIPCSRQDMEKVLGIDITGKKIILRVGRFVPHKGVHWFIRNVLPKLPDNYFFVAVGGVVSDNSAGDKNDFPACEKAIQELGLQQRAKLIGDIPERPDKLILMNCADMHIGPNIQVPGSMEGFGITAIEGGACGKVILSSNLEGLKDAIKDGENGFLVEPGDADAYIRKINEILSDDGFRERFGAQAKQYVIDNFSWDNISKKYLAEIEKIAAKK